MSNFLFLSASADWPGGRETSTSGTTVHLQFTLTQKLPAELMCTRLLEFGGCYKFRNWFVRCPDFRRCCKAENLAVRYLWAEIKRSKSSFFTGVFTVWLVTLFSALLMTTINKSNMIFFHLAEVSAGENDLLLTPDVSGIGGFETQTASDLATSVPSLELINQTYLDEMLKSVVEVAGTAPRWILLAQVVNQQALDQSASAVILAFDTLRERAIQMGRTWDRPPLQAGECYLSRTVVRHIGLDPTERNQPVLLNLDVFELLTTLGLSVGGDSPASQIEDLLALVNPELSAALDSSLESSDFLKDFRLSDFADLQQLVDLLQNAAGVAPNGTVDVCLDGRTLGVPSDFFRNISRNISLDVPDGSSSDSTYQLNATQLCFQVVNGTVYLNASTLVEDLLLSSPMNVSIAQIQDLLLDNFNFTLDLNQTAEFPVANLSVADLDEWFNDNILNQLVSNLTYADILGLLSPALAPLLQFRAQLIIKDVVNEPDGKWASNLGSVMVLEADELFGLLKEGVTNLLRFNISTAINISPLLQSVGVELPPPFNSTDIMVEGLFPVPYFNIESLLQLANASQQTISQVTSSVDDAVDMVDSLQAYDYSFISLAQYIDRIQAYTQSDAEELRHQMITFTDSVALHIGVTYPAAYLLPIALALENTQLLSYFLATIFGAITAVMAILGMLLIYSLLLNDVSAKTYEYGMLRALGMKHGTLVQILLTKSAMFSVLGVSLGLLGAWLVNIPITRLIADLVSLLPVYALSPKALAVSISIGFGMPLLANVVPIRRALSKTLRDSLDVYHHVINELTVKVMRLAELGIDLWQTVLSVFLLVVGVITFYLVPYAFTFGNFSLFLGILNAILLGMMFGLCILAQLVQPCLERFLLLVLKCTPHHFLYDIVRKNLSAHRSRNAKTFAMFTVTLAFVIFAGVMFALQGQSITDNLKNAVGSDVAIIADSYTNRLAYDEMKAYLQEQMTRPDNVILGYSFITYPLKRLPGISATNFGNLAHFPNVENDVYGVSEDFLAVTYNEYYTIAMKEKDTQYPQTGGKDDAIKLMYTQAGQAVLPQEEGGILVPPPVASGPYQRRFAIDYNTEQEMTSENSTTDFGIPYTLHESQQRLEQAYLEYIDAVTSVAHVDFSSITTSVPLKLTLDGSSGGRWAGATFLLKARGLLQKCPGFFFSSYRVTAFFAPVLVSFNGFARMAASVSPYKKTLTEAELPYERLLVRIHETASMDQREDVINGLSTFFRSDKTIAINMASLLKTIDFAVDTMNLLFQVVGVCAMVLCFFILWLSFAANINENVWEFGVLRAVGLSAKQVVMTYIYEALVLVFAALLCGTTIGLLVASSLTLQFNLFTEMPFRMQLPVGLFVSMVSMALIVAVLGSYIPARELLTKTINDILRRV
eukprot:g3892.t1